MFCHRVIQVSGAIPLSVLADKVILPVMGWTRNYHGYTFISQADSTVFGPNKTAAYVDMKHMSKHGVFSLDDEKYTLAHLLIGKASSIVFNYDLANVWRHYITIESIIPASEATGRIALLSGAGACPPEDHNLNPAWQSRYDLLVSFKIDETTTGEGVHLYVDCQHEVHNSMNYKFLLETDTRRTKKAFIYDPHHFDLDLFQKRLVEAIGSRASDKTGPKTYAAHPFDILSWSQGKRDGFLGPAAIGIKSPFKKDKGSRLVARRHEDDGVWHIVEHVRIGEEPKGLCAGCGFVGVSDAMEGKKMAKENVVGVKANEKLNEEKADAAKMDVEEAGEKTVGKKQLQRCSRCKGIWYCGRECQMAHWNNHRKACKADAAAFAAAK
jgi:hypothetical protein